MMSKFSSRNLTSVLMATALILGASVALSTSANAVGKQGTACTKLKSKSGIYTCIANPLASTPKYTYATADCNSAQTDYLANVAQLATYTTNANNTISQTQSSLASYQNALTTAQAALADINTKVYTISASTNTTVIGIDNAIAAVQAKLAADQALVTATTAALAKDPVGSQAARNDAATLKAYTNAVTSRQHGLDTLTRTQTRIQKQVTSAQSNIVTWTSTVNGAIAQQKALTAQLKDAITTAANGKKLACKKGL